MFTIKAVYEYTYDDGDNMVTKVSPFEDNFNDGNGTGWTTSGTWTFTGNEARSDVDSAWDLFYRTVTDDDHGIRFDYVLDSASTAAHPAIDVYFRHNTMSGECIILRIRDARAELLDHDGCSPTQVDIDTSADSDLVILPFELTVSLTNNRSRRIRAALLQL